MIGAKFSIHTGLTAMAIALLASIPARAQAAGDPAPARHPFILATSVERPAVLRAIAASPERTATRDAMQRLINPVTEARAATLGEFLKTLPPFDAQGEKHRHTLSIAVYAATLHYLTENEDYAQLAADILQTYLSEIARREPGKIQLGGAGYEAVRYLYERIGLTYDLLHPFLMRPSTTVFDPGSGKQIPFDDKSAQQALHHLVLDAFGNTDRPDSPGRTVTNHVILNANGCLYPIFCLKDVAERERLFDIFWNKGAQKQGAFRTSFLAMYTRHGQGVLPESSSYGTMMPFGILATIDRYQPELKVFADPTVREILEGPFLFPQWVNPDGRSIRYGDGKRNALRASGNLMAVLGIARRMGYTDLERRANAYLNALSENKLGVAPVVDEKEKPDGGIGTRDYSAAVALLKTDAPVPRDPSVPARIDYGRTVLIKHAGLAMLRNWVDKENVLYGLSGYIGGGHYVHSHCTGIGMELYGGGYVMTPSAGDSGAGDGRAGDLHASYRRLPAGNNTVVVNGTSHGTQQGAWKTESNVYQDTAVNIACEPSHLAEAISENFGFATQRLDDKVNKCVQERTLALVRTGPQSGYYLDLFRSRSLGKNQFHDYIHHNIGDATELIGEGGERFPLAATDRYDNDIGDLVKSPGWRFFEQEKTTPATSIAVRATFRVERGPRFMHLFAPGGVARSFTTALGPPTPEEVGGYDRKKTQILAIRQDGEAWDKPFAMVFEPSVSGKPTIASVKHLTVDGKVVGVEVRSVVSGNTLTDVILENDQGGKLALPDLRIELDGRFAIVRTEQSGASRRISLYLGAGERLRCGTHEVVGGNDGKAFRSFCQH
jgi:hypothetical protein